MSGDRPAVILAGETDSPIAALVRAAGLVATNAGVPVAVIGGLAVTCRLATASHRATGDVDIVSDAGAEDSLVAPGPRPTSGDLHVAERHRVGAVGV